MEPCGAFPVAPVSRPQPLGQSSLADACVGTGALACAGGRSPPHRISTVRLPSGYRSSCPPFFVFTIPFIRDLSYSFVKYVKCLVPAISASKAFVPESDYNAFMLYRLAWWIALGMTCLLFFPTTSAQSFAPLNQRCRQAASSDNNRADSPAVTIAELNFGDDLQMPKAEQAKIAAALTSRVYQGPPEAVVGETAERVRGAWQEHGYFKVEVSNYDFTVLTSNSVAARIALAVHMDEGPQYRLRQITFKNTKAITNVQSLRSLFPMKDGDLFNVSMVREGLDNLRRVYGELGHINFTSVPDTQVDEETRTISLVIDVDEGKTFYISSVNVIGLEGRDESSALKEFSLAPGHVYNTRLVQEFFNKYGAGLPPDSIDSHIQRQLDEQNGTLSVTFDFRSCAINSTGLSN